jgi:hypothetical protein
VQEKRIAKSGSYSPDWICGRKIPARCRIVNRGVRLAEIWADCRPHIDKETTQHRKPHKSTDQPLSFFLQDPLASATGGIYDVMRLNLNNTRLYPLPQWNCPKLFLKSRKIASARAAPAQPWEAARIASFAGA